MNRCLSITLLATLFLGLALAACAAPAGGEPAAKPTSAPASAAPARAAWEEKWAATLAAARKEGKVAIYGFVGPELRDALTGAIKNELGFEVELVVGKGAEVSTRFMAEWKAGINAADIMLFGASTFLTNLDPEVVLDPIGPNLILPEVTGPAAWRGPVCPADVAGA